MSSNTQQMFDLVEHKKWTQLRDFLALNHAQVTPSALETVLVVCAKHGMETGVTCLIPYCGTHALYEAAIEAWTNDFNRTFKAICPHLDGNQHSKISINIAKIGTNANMKTLLACSPKHGERTFETAMWFALSSVEPTAMVQWLLPLVDLDKLKHNIDHVNRDLVVSIKFNEIQGMECLQNLINQRQRDTIQKNLDQPNSFSVTVKSRKM